MKCLMRTIREESTAGDGQVNAVLKEFQKPRRTRGTDASAREKRGPNDDQHRTFDEVGLLQGLHVFGNDLGIVGSHSSDGFLVRGLLGLVAFGEQIGDLISSQRGTLHCGADLALSFRTMAGSALSLVDGGSIGGKR